MDDLRRRLEESLGAQYAIERELGGGGMSRVFLAEDQALGRRVVIKVLSPELAAVISADRFQREVRLAAALQHPHIVPLLTAGQAGDTLYYTMPFIEGESLRVRLSREHELPVPETVRLFREIVDAIAYAHRQGIVHRDIKPDNVLLSQNHAVVTDFGIAKALTAAGGAATLTATGVTIGTPAYMAPEQATGDAGVDHRADIYSLGALAYEMLAGEPPFRGATAQALIAAQLTRNAPPLTEARPAVPAELAAAVHRCLEKRPADRFQKAEELLAALEGFTAPTPSGVRTTATGVTPVISSGTEAALRQSHPVRVAVLFGIASVVVLAAVNFLVNQLGLPGWVLFAAVGLLLLGLPIMLVTSLNERRRLLARTTAATIPAPSGGLQRLFTWRRVLTGGGIAFAGLAAGAAGFMGLRMAGVGPFATLMTAGVLKQRDRLLVADFENRTADSTVAASVTEALRIDLSRSPTVRLIESGDVAATLRQMQRDPATPLTAQVAREVAERGGATAVVTGEIASLGTGYVLSVRLIGTKDGATLLAERESAADAAGLIPAVDKLSRKVREGIGESLRSIRGGEPLEQVTTGSLEALRKYSQAERAADAGQNLEARGLLEEAIQLDSGFAMAHRKLAVVLSNTRIDNARMNAEVRRAFELRDRLPERERLLATAFYYSVLDYDSDKVIAAYRQLLETWPDDATALTNLSDALYSRRRYAEAEDYARRGIAGAPTVGELYVNAMMAQVDQGKFAAADTTFRQWSRVAPGSGQRLYRGSQLAYAKGDYEGALALADSAGLRGDPVWRARSHHQRAAIFRTRGQIGRAAEEELAEARILGEMGAKGQALSAAIEWATIPGDHLGHPDVAVRRLDSVLARNPLDSIAVVDRPYLNLAANFVRQGAVDRAERLIAEYDRLTPAEVKRGDFERIYAGAMVALGRQRYEEALSGFHEYTTRVRGELPGRFEIARTFDATGQTDSALAAFQQYATTPEMGRPNGRQLNLPRTFRRLGELYEAKNDREKALDYYGKFTGLWKDADPELMPQVQEVKKRMAALVAEPRKP